MEVYDTFVASKRKMEALKVAGVCALHTVPGSPWRLSVAWAIHISQGKSTIVRKSGR